MREEHCSKTFAFFSVKKSQLDQGLLTTIGPQLRCIVLLLVQFKNVCMIIYSAVHIRKRTTEVVL